MRINTAHGIMPLRLLSRSKRIGGDRRNLFASASLVAVATLVPLQSAHAQTNPFGAQWYNQAGVVAGRTGSTNPNTVISPEQQRQVNVSIVNVQRAADALRTARVEQATAQSAARAGSAVRADGRVVPNGIVRGGLWYARGAVTGDNYDVTTAEARAGTAANGLVWQGANLPTQTSGVDVVAGANGTLTTAAAVGRELVTVQQTSSASILTWQNFDIGGNTTLYIQQTAADGTPQRGWTSLNRVVVGAPDASGARVVPSDPRLAQSLILGKIRSEGQVYVINQNGIIFGAGSDVNTNTLVASSLDIGLPYQSIAERNAYFLTNKSGRTNFSFQYLFEASEERRLQYGKLKVSFDPALTRKSSVTIKGRSVDSIIYAATIAEDAVQGDVTVEAGARIVTSPLDASGNPTGLSNNNTNIGRIVLAAPRVANAGNLRADDGQVALLGTRNFSIYANDGLSGVVADPSVRGAQYQIGQQDLQAIDSIVAGARPSSFINSSLAETIFGNAPEGFETIRAASGALNPSLIVGVAQGGSNYNPDPTLPAAARLKLYTDLRRPYVVQRTFINGPGLATAYVGSVTNTGIVDVPRGSVTVRAGDVVQRGIVTATTSVNQAGLIDIRADSTTSLVAGLNKFGLLTTPTNRLGTVAFAPQSVTSILPDAQVQADGSQKTIPSDALSLANFSRSQIRVATYNGVLREAIDRGPASEVNRFVLTQAPTIGDGIVSSNGEVLSAGSIDLASGSLLLAPSGLIKLTAAAPLQTLVTITEADPRRYSIPTGFTAGLTIGTDGVTGDRAVLDVAGLADVVLPMASNVITVARVGQNELADSPTQRNGFLFRQRNILVDRRLSGVRSDGTIWQGTPLFDATGYINARGQLVNELMTSGGTIDLAGAVAVGKNATLNVAGGLLTYAAGNVATTVLLTADGKRTVDIGRASIDDQYSGFAGTITETNSRFSQSVTYNNLGLASGAGTFEESYFEGGNGGTIKFSGVTQQLPESFVQTARPIQPVRTGASLLAFEGLLNAGAITGVYQHVGSLYYNAKTGLPKGGMLDLSNLAADTVTIASAADLAVKRAASPSAFLPTVVTNATILTSSLFLNQYWSTETLQDAGLGSIIFGNAGVGDQRLGQLVTRSIAFGRDAAPLATDITPFSGVASLVLPDGAALSLTAQNIDVSGTITARGGALNFILPSGRFAPGQFDVLGTPVAALLPRSSFALHSGSILDVSGRFVNDASASRDAFLGYGFVNGGSIAIGGGAYLQTIDLAGGSTLDLSSGGYVTSVGRLGTSGGSGVGRGRGGNLTLAIADQTLRNFVTLDPAVDPKLGYTGSLENVRERIDTRLTLDSTIKDFGFQGGGTFKLVAPSIAIGAGGLGGTGGDIRLNPAFFSDRGFGAFDLTGVLTTIVEPDVRLVLSQQQFLPSTTLAAARTLAEAATLGQWAPNTLQRAPVNFALTGLGRTDSRTRAEQSTVDNVEVNRFFSSSYSADRALTVGPGASILADAGATIALSATGQLRIGDPLDARAVSIRAAGGAVSISQNFGVVDVGGGKRAFYDDSPLSVGVPVSFTTALIASGTSIDAKGVFLRNALVTDYTTGTLLSGGRVSFGTNEAGRPGAPAQGTREFFGGTAGAFGGALLVQSGVTVDISGATATIAVPTSELVRTYATQAVASDAGTISLSATDFVGKINGHGGGTSAGATLISATDAIGQSTSIDVDAARALARPGLSSGTNRATTGALTADLLNGSGIDAVIVNQTARGGAGPKLTLEQNFTLAVARSLIITADEIAYGEPASTAVPSGVAAMAANYVRLQSRNAQNALTGTTGGIFGPSAPTTARLTVSANTLDIAGNVKTTGFGTTALSATRDIRLTPVREQAGYAYSAGVLAGGDLLLTAAQIYPTTGVSALLAASTASGTTLFDSGTITIRGTGAVPTAPLSAGGSLTLSARKIDQGGVIRAPLGTITLGFAAVPDNSGPVFTQSVVARAGSLTSVALDGLTVPYGQTTNGTSWRYANLGGGDLSSLPAKAINIVANGATLEGAADGRSAAVLDLSGSGDVYATEFVPGLGGQRDVLQTSLSTVPGNAVYAIVPGDQPLVAPVDPQGYSNLVPDAPGRTVTLLADAGGLKAGTYTLYPGYYATLPGAYRIEAVPGLSDLASSETIALVDGSVIAAGLSGFAGTSVQSSRNAAFRISNAAAWKQYSQIDITSGNAFFTNLAAKAGVATPRLPVDAGRLSLAIAATDQALRTAADIRFGITGSGRGGQVDIAASKIAIVSDALLTSVGAPLAKTLLLTPRQLAAFGATSILLGGTRTTNFFGDHVDIKATDIRVATSAADPLVLPELILVTGGGDTDPTLENYNPATAITVLSGSVIRASGATSGIAPAIELGRANTRNVGQPDSLDGQSGDGGFLRISVNNAAALTRLNPYPTPAGTVTVASTAAVPTIIDGGQSLQIDGSATVNFDLSAQLGGRNVALASNRVNLTNAPGQTGTTISGATLQLLANADTLALTGRTAITLDAPLRISASAGSPRLGKLTIDTPTIIATGLNGGAFALDATAVKLTNSNSAATLPSIIGTAPGTLAVTSDVLTLTGLDRTVQGFDRFALTAAKSVTLGDKTLFGTLRLPGTLVVSTPQVLLDGASDQRIVTTGAASFISAAGQVAGVAPGNAISGKFALDATGDVTLGTAFSARNGDVSFRTRTGNLTLTDAAAIDARGFTQTFIDKDIVLGGGKVVLFADTGNGNVAAGARVDVSADPRGNAGSIEIATGGVQSQFAITRGFKGAANGSGQGGSFVLDSAGSIVLEPLAQTLVVGGFTNQIAITSGIGNLDLTTTTLVARGVSLEAGDRAAGGGFVNVATTIDASGPEGGTISLIGQQGVNLASSARLLARATKSAADGAGGRGGSVTIATGVATPDTAVQTAGGAIRLAAGAQIDVSDAAGYSSAQSSSGAAVHIRAPIIAGSVDVDLGATVTGARTYALEGYRRFTTQNSAFDGIIDPAGWFTYNPLTNRAEYVRGTWRDPYGGIVPAGDPQNGVADPTRFTEASYFAPSYYDARGNLIQTANQAHVDFYQKTLVNFVQTAGGVDPSGFANVPGLVFRPGIELVNSDPARLGGDVQVLSNWNFGAGTTANSLFYRTTAGAQPGLLSVRALGNVVVKASISDGFYRTTPVSQWAEFNYDNAVAVFDGNPYGQQGLGRPRRLSQFGLTATDPISLTANQYYRLYDYYALRLKAFQAQYVTNIGPESRSFALLQTAAYISADPARNYSAYSVQYQAYLKQVFASNEAIAARGSEKFVRAVLPVAAASDADYGSYAANYFAYTDLYLNGLFNITGSFLPISAPASPRGTVATDPSMIAFNRALANDIANNATAGDPNPVTGSQLNKAGNSWSYQFTAGAATGSANVTRLAGRDSGAGNFTIGSNVLTSATSAGSGNIVRTGTGEIGITARGNANWANINDVIYTAGIDAGILPGFIDTAAILSRTAKTNAFLYGQTNTAGVFAKAGGDIRLDVLGSIGGARARGALVTAFRAPVLPDDPSDSSLGIAVGPSSSYVAGAVAFGVVTPNSAAWWLSNQGASGSNPATDGAFGGSSLGLDQNLNTIKLPALQSAEWVTTGRISGSLAAVGGGNISVRAGGTIDALTVAVASTFAATGGKLGAGGPGIPAVAVTRFGGGNITLRSGSDVRALSLLNARGRTTLDVGGSLSQLSTLVEATNDSSDGSETDFFALLGSGAYDLSFFPFQPFDVVNIIRPSTVHKTVITPNRFKIEDGQLVAAARGAIEIGSLDNNAASNRLRSVAVAFSESTTTPVQGAPFSQLGAASAASFVAAIGDITLSGITPIRDGRAVSADPYATVSDGILMPAALQLASLRGNVTINDSINLAPSASGNLDLLAFGSIYSNSQDGLSAPRILMSDQAAAQAPSIINPQVGISVPLLAATELHAPSARPLHANDTEPSRIIALTGDIATGPGLASAPVPNFVSVGQERIATQTVLAEPAIIFAGRDIIDMNLVGQNVSASNVTSVTAGRDIGYTFTSVVADGKAVTIPLGGTYTIGGEGRLALVAGRDLSLSPTIAAAGPLVRAEDRGALTVGNDLNPYLQRVSANIDILFGVGPTVAQPGNAAVAAFVETYINPANAKNLLTDYGTTLQKFVNDRLTKAARERDATTKFVSALSIDGAYAAFAALPASDQRALVQAVFFNEIRVVADPGNTTQYQNFSRVYRAIDTLFPAAQGYTDNLSSPVKTARTGNFDMVSALLRTSYGGDVNILGPGGNATIGGLAIDNRPQGILTLRGGGINIFTDGNLAVNSSRVFTLQGGDEVIYTTNGNIDAGRGKRTAAFLPPLLINYLPDATGVVNFGGLVTGAGIGTLQTLPNSAASDVFLLAPRGDIDAGDAGIRSSRNLFVVANRVFNADNIAVGGKSVGVPQAPTVSASAVTTAGSVGAAGQQTTGATGPRRLDPQAIISVQVQGFAADDDEAKRRKRDKR